MVGLVNRHIDLATDELLNKYDSVHEYVHNEEGEWVLIWTDTIIRDFKFISVYGEDNENNEITFTVEDVLTSVEELTPEKPLALKWTPNSEVISGCGISFIDENDAERYYIIQASGRDIEEAPPYLLIELDESGNIK